MSKLLVDSVETLGGRTQYPVRGWVNFNGSGTIAIRASAAVSSLVDIAMGNWAVNHTVAMEDVGYAWSGSCGQDNVNQTNWIAGPNLIPLTTWKTTAALRVISCYQNAVAATADPPDVSLTFTR